MLRYLILAILAVGTYAQAPCSCSAMVTAETGELILYEMPPVDLQDCNADNECRKLCSDEFDVQTNGGDLNSISSDGTTSVGQSFCNTAQGNIIDTKFVYAYYNLCNTNWQYTNDQSIQPLCCEHNGNYYECP
ncbi:hypothetical protein SK128_007639 [Halocaridina rubra]|uniref:Uncharacterized protein n=1 Tax=Halocaridina rubra TaxID=373956 RepID=A0AAN8WG54_HALRR